MLLATVRMRLAPPPLSVSPPASAVASTVTPVVSAVVRDPLVSVMVWPDSPAAKSTVSAPAAAPASARACRSEPAPESAVVVTVNVAPGNVGAVNRARKRMRCRMFFTLKGVPFLFCDVPTGV